MGSLRELREANNNNTNLLAHPKEEVNALAHELGEARAKLQAAKRRQEGLPKVSGFGFRVSGLGFRV